jgi:ubiquinone/menaquinone biosynthesis C-methylase UbiE
MEPTPEMAITVLKNQIAKTQRSLNEMGYDPASTRRQVAELAQGYGSPALDVGTGACACLAIELAHYGLKVTAVDHASSAVRMAEERASGTLSERLEIRHAEASRLPFADGSYRVVTAFDALCHANEPGTVLKEMLRVSSQAVIITELNASGREITQHLDGGFHEKLPALLARHCANCQRYKSNHYITYLCEKK